MVNAVRVAKGAVGVVVEPGQAVELGQTPRVLELEARVYEPEAGLSGFRTLLKLTIILQKQIMVF